jgi:hypothetical protein
LALVISACCLQGRCPEEFVTGGTVLAVAGLHPRSRQFQDVTRVPNVLVQSLNRLVDEKSLLHQNMFVLKVTRFCVEGNTTNHHICFEPESAGFFAPPTSRGVMRMLFFSIHLDQHLSSSLFGYVVRHLIIVAKFWMAAFCSFIAFMHATIIVMFFPCCEPRGNDNVCQFVRFCVLRHQHLPPATGVEMLSCAPLVLM